MFWVCAGIASLNKCFEFAQAFRACISVSDLYRHLRVVSLFGEYSKDMAKNREIKGEIRRLKGKIGNKPKK